MKLLKALLKAVDWVAMFVAFLGFTMLIAAIAVGAVSYVWQALRSMWHSNDRILLIIIGVAVAWCAFRWKELNKRR